MLLIFKFKYYNINLMKYILYLQYTTKYVVKCKQ